MSFTQLKRCYALAGIVCFFAIGFALFAQNYWDLKPCSLCVIQRVIFLTLGIFFIAAAFWAFSSKLCCWIFNSCLLVISLCGTAVASKQIWLQHLPPDKVPMCGPGLNYLLENYPLLETLKIVLEGSGDCAKVDWQVLGLSMADLSFALFTIFFLLATTGYFVTYRRLARSP